MVYAAFFRRLALSLNRLSSVEPIFVGKVDCILEAVADTIEIVSWSFLFLDCNVELVYLNLCHTFDVNRHG